PNPTLSKALSILLEAGERQMVWEGPRQSRGSDPPEPLHRGGINRKIAPVLEPPHHRPPPQRIAQSSRITVHRKHQRLLQHGVIPGASQTKAHGISSPGTNEASLMWPPNDGERQWNIMLDWTCR